MLQGAGTGLTNSWGSPAVLGAFPNRQADGHIGSPAHIAFDLEFASVPLDDVEIGGQSESHFHAGIRSVEIQIEDVIQLIGGNAHAGVADLDCHRVVVAPGANPDLAFSLDGLNGVFEHVHEDLIELVGGAEDRLQVGVISGDGDVVAHLRAQQYQRAFQSFVNVRHLEFRWRPGWRRW